MRHASPIPARSARSASPRRRRVGVDSAMRRGLHLACLVLWLAAMGVHWDVLQVFAWANMLQENLRTLPAATAVARTFQPEGMCRMCKAVQSAKQERENSPVAPERLVEKSPLLLPAGTRVIVTVPPSGRAAALEDSHAPVWRTAPPTPPPRAA